MLHFVILCYIMLYYVILCYIMLHYVILRYIMGGRGIKRIFVDQRALEGLQRPGSTGLRCSLIQGAPMLALRSLIAASTTA